MARLTEQEKKDVMQFQNSPLGRKQQELGPRISRESMEYLNARLANTLKAAIAPFHEQLMEQLKETQTK
jgi:hypothetical protein